MESQHPPHYPLAVAGTVAADPDARLSPHSLNYSMQESIRFPSCGHVALRALSIAQDPEMTAILTQIKSGQLFMVNRNRRNGLILCKAFHAEFAGPGAAIGGSFDLDCEVLIPIGNLSIVSPPEDYDERQDTFKIRRQWLRLTQQFTDDAVPLHRARKILDQFKAYFKAETVSQIPDEAFALLVGVLPHTMRLARRPPGHNGRRP